MFKLKNLFTICFLVFGFFPVLPSNLKGLPVVLLLLISIYIFFSKEKKYFSIKVFLIFSSLFIINILSLLNTFSFPIKEIETMLSLILVPFAFSTINEHISKTHKKHFIISYIISSLLLAVSHLLYYYSENLFHDESLKVNSFRKAVVEIPVVGDHPIYISFFLSIAIIFSIHFLKKYKGKLKIIIMLFCFLYVLDLFLISSKGVIIALIISILVYYFTTLKGVGIKLAISSLFIGTFLLSIFYFPTMERRFRELKIKSTYNKIQPNNSSSIRIGIYQCVLRTIKEKPISGYGLGTFPQGKCYKELSNHLFLNNYNSHNQYLGYFLNAGILGIITLLYFLFFILTNAWIHRNYLYFSLIVFFSIVMLTENILERQSGIILFIFIVNLFFYFNANKNTRV